MKDEERLEVDGYLYGSEADAELAKEEKKKAKYLETRMNYEDTQNALKIYEMAIKEKIFKTPTGVSCLLKIRVELIKRGIPADDISPIPLYHIFSKEEEEKPVRIFQVKEKKEDHKEAFRMSLWANIILGILVIAMFMITMFGSNTNILNYKYKIENEYSSWKQQLQEKEEVLREWEAELKKAGDK